MYALMRGRLQKCQIFVAGLSVFSSMLYPYEGEEEKLHWANSDQYHINSGGGDNGRETANMLQFKINPAELIDIQ